jgi:hypothetical protein
MTGLSLLQGAKSRFRKYLAKKHHVLTQTIRRDEESQTGTLEPARKPQGRVWCVLVTTSSAPPRSLQQSPSSLHAASASSIPLKSLGHYPPT